MFGPIMRLKNEDTGVLVTLRPYWRREEVKYVAEWMSEMHVHRYLGRRQGNTETSAQAWWDRVSESETSVVWAIEVEGTLVGHTSIGDINPITRNCSSGIMISPEWWGNRIASSAHEMRTWYVANELNLSRIYSHVRKPNIASRKALEKVGYFVTSEKAWDAFIEGEFVSTLELLWINPRHNIDIKHLPVHLHGDAIQAIDRARIALERAERCLIRK